jgi:hypothetical protein
LQFTGFNGTLSDANLSPLTQLAPVGIAGVSTVGAANSVFLTAPVSLACDVALTNGTVLTGTEDTDPTTVDGGVISYGLTNTGGRFVLNNGAGTLLASGINCGSATPATTTAPATAATTIGATGALSGAPTTLPAGTTMVTPGGLESCKGAATVSGTTVTPNIANSAFVSLAAGVPISSFGSFTGIGAVGATAFQLSATYTRYASLNTVGLTLTGVAVAPGAPSVPANCTLTAGGPFPIGPGGGTATCTFTGIPTPGASLLNLTQALSIVGPTYYLGLSANPTTVPAQPNLSTPGVTTPGVAQGGNGQSSLITATMYTILSSAPFVVNTASGGSVIVGTPAGTIVSTSGAILAVGSEPGTVTFTTNNGIFGSPSTAATSAQQTVAVACGVLPGTSNLIYNPGSFSFGTFSFSSCSTATANLFGGGAAGTATVVGTFVGSITGQQATNAVTVAFSPVPNTVNLVRGCNEVITPASLAQNTPIATYLGTVAPSGVVVSIWQYNNAAQAFGALYFSTAGAPTNGTSVGGNQSVFICASGGATVGNGAY